MLNISYYLKNKCGFINIQLYYFNVKFCNLMGWMTVQEVDGAEEGASERERRTESAE